MLLPSRARMRDFVSSCYTHHAVKVFDSSRSANAARETAVPTSVTCLYRTRLRRSSGKHLDTYLTWSDSHPGQLDLYITVKADGVTHDLGQLLPRSKKGTSSLVSTDGSVVFLYWDVSSARYDSGPEPTEGFYVALLVDEEVVLLLGDRCVDQPGSNLDGMPIPHFSLVRRVEEVEGGTRFTSKARFKGEAKEHDICVECRDQSELRVWVDERKVMHAKKLRWNFRGNHTIFVDGLPVDMMWDLHDWWFQSGGGRAMFLFRARNGLKSALWLGEELQRQEEAGAVFSLLIQAHRSTSSCNPTTKKALSCRR